MLPRLRYIKVLVLCSLYHIFVGKMKYLSAQGRDDDDFPSELDKPGTVIFSLPIF